MKKTKLFIEKNIEYTHMKYVEKPSITYHFHDYFEIYLLLSGNVNYFIENKVYKIKHGDLLIMNNNEIHRPFFKEFTTYERIVVSFSPNVIDKIAGVNSNLLDCFTKRKSGENNLIKLTPFQVDELLSIFKKFETLKESPSEYFDILQLAYFIEVLVFVNKAYECTEEVTDNKGSNEIISDILRYIDDNLDSELSLEQLEKKFNYNKTYLCRLFKQYTGSSIHKHILYKRIAKSKSLISNGYSVSQSCILCGFNDYSSFYRVFKNTVGVSPVEYKKSVLNQTK